jgi:hypothetical protein
MKKLKLKEDEDGNKISEVKGIRAACKIMKTRFNKPFESIQVKIPYETGMSPYSGLVDLAEKAGLLVKDGNRLRFGDAEDKDAIKQFRKAWELNEDGCLDKLMVAYAANQTDKKISKSDIETMEDIAVEAEMSAVEDPEVKYTVDGHGDVHEVTEEQE